jgi:hypothetical protein
MAAYAITLPQYVGSMSRGAGPVSGFVAKQYENGIQELQKSFTFGQIAKGSLKLICVYEDCRNAGWDGYGAEPVSIDAFDEAVRFLRALPLGTPAPSVGAEPDGHITLEWYKSPRQTLSVSVSPEGQLHFAALMGDSKQYGTEPFYGNMPQAILDLIYRVSLA